MKERLEASPVSRSVNISFVERNNLTLRQQSRRLGRKRNGFSKDITRLEAQLYVALGYYHFFKEHFGLRRESKDNNKKRVQRTRAMAAGITDHIWSTRELLIYRVP
jgi:hypothetical protein